MGTKHDSRFDLKAFGAVLKTARKSQGLRARQLSKTTGFTPQNISNWENGHAFPSCTHLLTMMWALGLDPDAFKQCFSGPEELTEDQSDTAPEPMSGVQLFQLLESGVKHEQN